jgi:formylglycine-generating enzyme required for sulfatase activity
VEFVSWFDAIALANLASRQAGVAPCYQLEDVICADHMSVEGFERCMNEMVQGIESARVRVAGGATVYDCEGFRLPTEAEWEYAARAGQESAVFAGELTQMGWVPLDPLLASIAWYGTNSQVEFDSDRECPPEVVGPLCGTHPVGGKLPNGWGLYDMAGNVWEWVWDANLPYPSQLTENPSVDGEGLDRIRRGGSWGSHARDCRHARRETSIPRKRYTSVGFRLVRTIR